jgi:hypothetical protein
VNLLTEEEIKDVRRRARIIQADRERERIKKVCIDPPYAAPPFPDLDHIPARERERRGDKRGPGKMLTIAVAVVLIAAIAGLIILIARGI